MKPSLILSSLLALAFAPGAASGQAAAPASDSIETVTVTGMKQTPEMVAHTFINTYSLTTESVGAISRWDTAICPATVGLTPQFDDVVTSRVRAVAGMIGAKVKDAPCKTNVFISFTSQPQAVLDAAKEKNPDLIGPNGGHQNVITHAMQAWYATGTMDIRGNLIPDTGAMGMTEMPGKGWGSLPMAPVGGVPVASRNGSRLKDGLGSVFTTVFIVVDLNKVAKAPLSAIADYTAMLALAQTESYDTCKPLPSIANLMVQACADDKKASAMTPSDIAFLRGVYKSAVGAPLNVQQANIAAEMVAILPE